MNEPDNVVSGPVPDTVTGEVVYLDYNCFQRGFDDPGQIRIQMEALACQEIFTRAARNEVVLVWSFMHQDETILCPFPARRHEAFRLAALCQVRVAPDEAIRELALQYQTQAGLSAKDALHLACATHIKAACFLTCDDSLGHRAKRLQLPIAILNPVDYIRQGER